MNNNAEAKEMEKLINAQAKQDEKQLKHLMKDLKTAEKREHKGEKVGIHIRSWLADAHETYSTLTKPSTRSTRPSPRSRRRRIRSTRPYTTTMLLSATSPAQRRTSRSVLPSRVHLVPVTLT
jgi:hypothetical protein